MTIIVNKPTWLDRHTRLDGTPILAGETANGIEPIPTSLYTIMVGGKVLGGNLFY